MGSPKGKINPKPGQQSSKLEYTEENKTIHSSPKISPIPLQVSKLECNENKNLSKKIIDKNESVSINNNKNDDNITLKNDLSKKELIENDNDHTYNDEKKNKDLLPRTYKDDKY